MKLSINGEPVDTHPQTLADVLDEWGATPPFVVALNQTFIPKHQWSQTPVNENDAIDILAPISGG